MSAKLPPRALGAANRILVQLPRTGWMPLERDIAAAVIASECGESAALKACRMLVAAWRKKQAVCWSSHDESSGLVEAVNAARLALRR